MLMRALLLLMVSTATCYRPIQKALLLAGRKPSPLMRQRKETPAFELKNPITVIATVIAQADIVGYQPPRRVDEKALRRAAEEMATPLPPLPNRASREVDRRNLHPSLKVLGDDSPYASLLNKLLELPTPMAASLALPCVMLALPVLVPFIASRKAQWEAECAASAAEHKPAFEANWQAYLKQQRSLVSKLLEARASGARDAALPADASLGRTIAVTMATGQEGQAVVKALSAAPEHAGTTIRALVRDPSSAKAQELAALPRVEVVRADSVDADSLRAAMEGIEAVYLCTTLNNAAGGTWAMAWDGGAYELEQGEAFVKAAKDVSTLKQIVYGTAPLRKWPEAYRVEPPIHYAAKWRIEDMVTEAGLPLTCLRKCPYHENFTKLTKPKPSTTVDGAANGFWEPGQYFIKALTPSTFEYNMLGPGDIGAWALLALDHPSILAGESLSIAADSLTGAEMAAGATAATAFGPGVRFDYTEQPRLLFETLAFVEPTFVYISGLQRWNSDGGQYDLPKKDVEELRKLHAGLTWQEHLNKDGLEQFTATMAELLPDVVKS